MPKPITPIRTSFNFGRGITAHIKMLITIFKMPGQVFFIQFYFGKEAAVVSSTGSDGKLSQKFSSI
jgi:hypothetical protein